MKICIASRAPFVAGAEIACERLALGLQDRGHQVVLIVGSDGEALKRFEDKGIKCKFIPILHRGSGFGLKYFYHRRKLTSFLAKENPDILHSNDLPTHQMVSHAAKALALPVVCHHRWCYSDAKAIDWFNSHGANLHLFISNASANKLLSSSAQLASQPRMVIPDGVPIPPRPTDNERLRNRQILGLSKEKVVVAFVGQINEHKGVEDLIKAWAILTKRSDDFHSRAVLIIGGDDFRGCGVYRLKMQRLAEHLPSIRFIGAVENSLPLFSACDIAVVPSREEPFGLVTAEAMTQCVPVIGSATGGIPEVLEDGVTGVLVAPQSPESLSEAVVKLVTSKSLREEFGESGRKRVEKYFSMERHVDNILEAYQWAKNHSHHNR